jgi:hypothetical protein
MLGPRVKRARGLHWAKEWAVLKDSSLHDATPAIAAKTARSECHLYGFRTGHAGNVSKLHAARYRPTS